jgi:uncharacterized protein (DUF3084 family)
MDLIERIEHLLESAMSAVKAAAERRDVHALQQLTRRSQRLNELKDCVMEVDQEVRDLEGGAASESTTNGGLVPDRSVTSAAGRESIGLARDSNAHRMVIEVTQGMINQNLLTLTDHVRVGRIRPGAELKIEAKPSGRRFSTDLLSNGNRLRERGEIASFYRDARVRAGDRVLLTEVSPNHWTLEKFQRADPIPPVHAPEDDNQI